DFAKRCVSVRHSTRWATGSGRSILKVRSIGSIVLEGFMDPLSDVLALLRPNSYMAGGFDHGGDWSIEFPRHEGIKCFAVVSGRSWLVVEGISEPILLDAGDCFLLPRGFSFRLASDLHLAPLDALTLLTKPLNGRVEVLNGGGKFFGVGGHSPLLGPHARTVLAELPPVIHIRSEAGKAELRWYIERMRAELREQQPGGSLLAH